MGFQDKNDDILPVLKTYQRKKTTGNISLMMMESPTCLVGNRVSNWSKKRSFLLAIRLPILCWCLTVNILEDTSKVAHILKSTIPCYLTDGFIRPAK